MKTTRDDQKQFRITTPGIYPPRNGWIELGTLDREREGPETVAAGAAVVSTGFEILKSVITPLTKGDLNVTMPNGSVGVIWPSKPAGLGLTTSTVNALIINYRSASPIGIEQVNVRMRCQVQFNGPEVTATFPFDAEGRRSRLGFDTTIFINNPLSLETRPTSADWQRVGIKEYPVVRIPIEFRIDRWWPQSNYNQTFTLVLSGMYGLGASSEDREYIKDKRVVYN